MFRYISSEGEIFIWDKPLKRDDPLWTPIKWFCDGKSKYYLSGNVPTYMNYIQRVVPMKGCKKCPLRLRCGVLLCTNTPQIRNA